MSYKIFPILAVMILFISCDRPECVNTNPVFDQYLPNSTEYKMELINQLEIIDKSKLTYWLQKYEEVNGQEYLYFHIQGDDLCSILVLTMDTWDRLERVQQKKGVTFRGAEFTDLKFDIKQDSTGLEFVYESYDRIID